MATVRPFAAVRPKPELAARVATPPYDVVSLAEARQLAEGNPFSFLRVSRAELEMSDTVNPYSQVVYDRGAINLRNLMTRGVLYRERSPIFGVYRLQMGDHTQTGLVGLASVEEYDHGIVKRHELTRPDKETDRVRIIEAHESQSGPVLMTFRQTAPLRDWFAEVTATLPDVAFVAEDGIAHTVWTVRDEALLAGAQTGFVEAGSLYIADGHHRSAAASRVRSARRRARKAPGGADEGLLSVLFPSDELQILPYNRVVADLNGLTVDGLREGIAEHYELSELSDPGHAPQGGFDLYASGAWCRATPRPGVVPEDPVGRLAVSVFSDRVLRPLLAITDQRTDERIAFVGGIRGPSALASRLDSGEWAAAFWLDPTTVDELMAVADADRLMPPKSTWFEPKLRDGLFIHTLD